MIDPARLTGLDFPQTEAMLLGQNLASASALIAAGADPGPHLLYADDRFRRLARMLGYTVAEQGDILLRTPEGVRTIPINQPMV